MGASLLAIGQPFGEAAGDKRWATAYHAGHWLAVRQGCEMERWRDRPATELDPIERFVVVSSRFFKKYGAQTAKLAPPAAGFALFLLYFQANHFYPSFDLLQFSSLLLGAGMVGFTVIAVIWLGLLIPGLWIFHAFVERPEIRRQFTYWMGTDGRYDGLKILSLVFLWYTGPYCATALLAALVLRHFTELYAYALIGGGLLVTLMFGIVLQVFFKLPRFSFLRYAFNAWAPTFAVSGLAL